MGNEDIVQQVSDQATRNDHFSGCAQAVLGALQKCLSIGGVDSFRAATVLSGGVARRGETCGALLGALMALGIERGRSNMADTAAYNRATDESQSLVDAFEETLSARFGFAEALKSTLCRDIQNRVFGRSFRMSDSDERRAFIAAGGHDDNKCPLVCAVAAEVAARKILELRQNA